MNPSFSRDPLFATPRQPRRSSSAVVVSALLHAAAVALAVAAARHAMSTPLPRAARSLTFVRVLTAPDPALVLKPLPVPVLIKEPPKPVEVSRLEPPPMPERRPNLEAPVEPKPPAPEPKRETPAKIEPPKPAVTVGAFDSGAANVRTTEPARGVENAGFDAPTATGLGIQTRSASVGGFDQTAPGATASTRSRVVADAGFGTAMVSAPAQSRSRVVADAGFGAGRGQAAPASPPRQEVRTTDFDAKPAPKTTAAAPREPRVDVPLEILSKPTPAYTDEARTLKIEGDVVLDVQFSANGELRVLGVVHGLGHGLDESATRAAQGIRFKPAQSGGHPIDFRTTVHIVFRLA